MARVARADVNMPDYDGSPLKWLQSQVEFEAAVYHLGGSAEIPTSRLLYFRHPEQSEGPKTELPRNISAMLFDLSRGGTSPWRELNDSQKGGVASRIPWQQWTRLQPTGCEIWNVTDIYLRSSSRSSHK